MEPCPLDRLCYENSCKPAFSQASSKIYIGEVAEFSSEDIRNSTYDLLVRRGKIYLIPNPSDVHTEATNLIQDSLRKSLLARKLQVHSAFTFCAVMDAGLENVPDIYGCTKISSRRPDVLVQLRDSVSRVIYEYIIAVEVNFRNGDLSDLLTIGASYLSKHTTLTYALLFDLHEEPVDGKKTLRHIRVLLLKRKVSPEKNSTKPPMCVEVPDELENAEELDSEDLGHLLNVHVEVNKVITRIDLESDDFHLKIHFSSKAIIRMTNIPELMERKFIRLDVKPIAAKIFRFADAMMENGTYPRGRARSTAF